MSEFDIIAILKPKPGKEDRLEQLLTTTAAKVKSAEPGTLRYQVQKQTKVKKGEPPVFIMLERYKDQESLGVHGGSPHFKAFSKALKDEGVLDGAPTMYFTKGVGGFESKL